LKQSRSFSCRKSPGSSPQPGLGSWETASFHGLCKLDQDTAFDRPITAQNLAIKGSTLNRADECRRQPIVRELAKRGYRAGHARPITLNASTAVAMVVHEHEPYSVEA